jgi:hypothetical protein
MLPEPGELGRLWRLERIAAYRPLMWVNTDAHPGCGEPNTVWYPEPQAAWSARYGDGAHVPAVGRRESESSRAEQVWVCSGLTAIHQKAHSSGEDAQYGDHGAEERGDRRSFSDEFKAEIVPRCRAGDRSIAQVPQDFVVITP